MVIIPIGGAVVISYFFARRGNADEQDRKQWDNRIKTAIISVGGAFLGSTIVSLITHYYG